MKFHHPDIFCAALLNAQPMGFYQPAQLVRDAQEHGVEVRPVCVNSSRWDCTLEEAPPLDGEGLGWGGVNEELDVSGGITPTQPWTTKAVSGGSSHAVHPIKGEGLKPLRLGLRMVRGLSDTHAAQIIAVRADAPFTGIEDVWLRSGVPVAALEKLADADAFACFGLDRRQALWQVRGLGAAPLPLFAAADAREEGREPQVALAPLSEGREVFEDYRTVQVSLRAHPLSFIRDELDRRGITSCAGLAHAKDGSRVEVAGIVLIRQKPGQGNVTFITIEDESGIANTILWQRRFDAHRRVVMSSAMISVKGVVQREGSVIHVVADSLEDYTPLLRSVADMHFPHRPGPGDGVTHPGSPDRGERGWVPKSRSLRAPPIPPDVESTLRQKTRDFH